MNTRAATLPPPVRPAGAWRFPAAHESSLSNGLRLLGFDVPGQHVVSVAVVFDAPARIEPRALEGVANLTAETLTRGAGALTAERLADALATCGADLDASAGTDTFVVHLTVPVTHLERGLELLALVLTEATFTERELAQQQRLRLEEIELARAYPTVVVGDRLNAAVFGDARIARPLGGTIESVRAITRADVVDFATTWLHPLNATVVVAGAGAPDLAPGLWESTLGRWVAPSTWAPPEPGTQVQVTSSPSMLLVDWPDAAQAVVRVAGPGITRSDSRWPALFVANYVIGGSFGSRLNTVLREQRGLTYGIGSGLDSSRYAGLLAVGASVRSDSVAEAVSEIIGIVSAARGSLTEHEVADAVRATVDSAPLTYERAEAIAGRAEMLLAHGLPPDHVDLNLARIRDVTAELANRTLSRSVDPSAFTVVVAAPADAVADSLETLGHGALTVVERPR